jgi:glycosyltransferase involved in cell wall biosynthesis
MRIALITQRFPPLCCGVGDYTLGLARTLGEKGHDVIVITRPEPGARPAGIRVVEARLDGWGDLRSVLRLLERERVEQVQVEYSGYGWSRFGFSFWLNGLVAVLRWQGIRVNLGLHETYLNFLQHPLQIPIALLQRLHVWALIACASEVCVNMPERQRRLRRILPWCRAKVHYRPNSSTIPVAPLNEEERNQLRASRGAAPGDCVVATFGLFQKAKNLEAVIEAVAHARTARPLRLWLLGDPGGTAPDYIASLHAQTRSLRIEEKVFWSGYLPPAEISGHLQAADVFILPQTDGHLTRSSAFMAAAAHGMPVIAVRNPENQVEFEDGKNLLLAEKSSATEIAAKLESLSGDSTLRAKLGMNLRQIYRDRFDWPVTARMGTQKVPAFAASIDAAGSAEPARKI